MPAAFSRCVKRGGRVRYKRVNPRKQMKICFKGGKSYPGHVETRKTKET